MSGFEKQNEMAGEILTKHRGQVLAIVKATRAGATYSLLKKACELGERTLIVEPYKQIFWETIDEVQLEDGSKPRTAYLTSNEDMCEKVKEDIKNNREPKQLKFHLKPSCKKCEYNV